MDTTEGTALVPTTTTLPAPAMAAMAHQRDLVTAFLGDKSRNTVRAYEQDLHHFAAFTGTPSAGAAAELLVSLDAGSANALVLGWRSNMLESGLAPATITRRLATLRSISRMARLIGRITWRIEVPGLKTDPLRDTRGPGRDGWRAVLAAATADATDAIGRRDLAILRLLHDLALRRSEVAGLDLADLDLDRGEVMVRGKGRAGQLPMTLPPATRAAIVDWLTDRGQDPGPLFLRLDLAAQGGADNRRLSDRTIHKHIVKLGVTAALSRTLRPHGLRHQGITAALDATGGDVRKVRQFSRHEKLDTLLRYDDQRRDAGGEIAGLVAEE